MDNAAIITRSLEIVGERGDPTDEVYRRLFAEFPETEGRFCRDVTGAIKAEMLTMVFDCLMDPGGPYQLNLIRAERVNHDGFGTPNDVFDRFFDLVHAGCREVAGPDWRPEFDDAWRARIASILDATS